MFKAQVNFLASSEHVGQSFKVRSAVPGLVPLELYLGQGNPALEIVVFKSTNVPKSAAIKKAWKHRRDNRTAPVLVVVFNGSEVSLFGITSDKSPVVTTNNINLVERMCNAALSKPDRHTAISYLNDALLSLNSELPGIKNQGLLTLHTLTHDSTRTGYDWSKLCRRADGVLNNTKQTLLTAFDYTTEDIDNLTILLKANEERTALAVLLNLDETPEHSSKRFKDLSPVTYALNKADKENLKWVIIVRDASIRLYATQNIGVGRRGRTETFIECQSSLLDTKDTGYLWLLFSADALCKNGTIYSLFEDSKRFAADIAKNLRERIYDIVVPELAIGIVEARNLSDPSQQDLTDTYEMALIVLFRILFIAYAEDCNLLPYKSNDAYRRRSLKSKAQELEKTSLQPKSFDDGDHHYAEVSQLWRAIERGNKEWDIPAYGGIIFSSKPELSLAGAKLNDITLTNNYFAIALRGLLLTESSENLSAPIDFRNISVREFGTIYEGLLESELSMAKQDLFKDRKDTYLPAGKDQQVDVKTGEIYLHNRSGARKSTGSYYTPDFAVECLLNKVLEPALKEHLDSLKHLDDAERLQKFFDFRVADIAMGSGHFLVSAIDRIERQFSMWLDENPTPGIMRELDNLRAAAKQGLSGLSHPPEIEDGQLLRRMIARRCIYGVDLNPLAVQLSRLSVWIHTFVPGLPLSLLDHALVHGNALVGIGSMDEIYQKFADDTEFPLFKAIVEDLLHQAAEPLKKLANLTDASRKDIDKGRALIKDAHDKAQVPKALCDLITAEPVSDVPLLNEVMFAGWDNLKNNIFEEKALVLAREILDPLNSLHFPVEFPEVFLEPNAGFNVVVGNPPWEKVKVEEHDFLAHKFPGLRGLTQRQFEVKKTLLYKERPELVDELRAEKNRVAWLSKILHSSSAYIMGVGDPDLYQAFSWRFWQVIAKQNGRLGVVLPRSIMVGKGSEKFRKKIFSSAGAVEVITLKNTAQWIFDITPQYTVVFFIVAMHEPTLVMRGPFSNRKDFNDNINQPSENFLPKEVLNWNKTASLPLLRTSTDGAIFRQLLTSPSLSQKDQHGWSARPYCELHATQQKPLMDMSKKCPTNFWPVYKGESFNIWVPDTEITYAWADPEKILPWLQSKRLNSKSNKNSVFAGFSTKHLSDSQTLASHQPRIAFRDTARATDHRTTIACLVPPKVLLQHVAPYLLFTSGNKCDEAYLLGILCSIPLDWYARRFVEMHMTFYIFNSLPIPRPPQDSLLKRRVIEIAGRLACPDERYSDWAEAVGVEVGILDGDDKQDKIHELDAVVALLYGLSESQLIHIFETFHVGWNYSDRFSETLKHFHTWADKK